MRELYSHSFWSSVLTLTLGILGSSCLPICWAFSRCGVVTGLLLSVVVAISNAYTGNVVLVAAYVLKKSTYEGMCEAASSSKAWKVGAQISLILLLFGTLAGDAALLADSGTKAIAHFEGSPYIPDWFLNDSRYPMLLLTAVLVIPLSFTKHIKSLERAAVAGLLLIIGLIGIIMNSALSSGLPAIRNGELPIFGLPSGTRGQIPAAFSVLSFAFYLQPMLLPLLSEMPGGAEGLWIMCKALRVVTLGIALATYSLLGFFGAARYGKDTAGDLLMNEWLPQEYSGYLDAAMAAYLAISMAPIVVTMRYMLESIGNNDSLDSSSNRLVYVRNTMASILLPTLVAAVFPKESAMIFAATGATAVCMISYIFPIGVHAYLYFGKSWRTRAYSELDQWLVEDTNSHADSSCDMTEDRAKYPQYPSYHSLCEFTPCSRLIAILHHIILPSLVLLIGLGSSLIALLVSIHSSNDRPLTFL